MDMIRHYSELLKRLQSLRELISGSGEPSYLEQFDEFLREQEFGLALETLCDFLLARDVPCISEAQVEEIESLHELMSVSDTCVRSLREKSGGSERSR